MDARMPRILQFLHALTTWRIDSENDYQQAPSTPIITIISPVDEPVKNIGDNEATTEEGRMYGQPRRLPKIKDWIVNVFQIFIKKIGFGSRKNKRDEQLSRTGSANEKPSDGLCHISQSPFRILRAAESGNLEIFKRLYHEDISRLHIQDPRGRTPAHQAASRNKVNILQFILDQGGDLNAQDNCGNTPLHIAVEHAALDAVDFLLSRKVKTDILNEKNQAPIHLVAELNKVSVLEVMGRYKDKINIQQGGEHGRLALHIAAIYDHEECAKLLISEFGASPKIPCNNGYYPIHEAAKNASSKSLEVFLQWAESRGCSRQEMISLYDSEGNVPLHSAVHGGDIRAVEICIKSGAKISIQQQDLSTPVHLACSQGATEIVKLMFTMQPEEKAACLCSCDIQKMTPLHCAAMFDHPEIVEYLVLEGADINAMDKERRSPMLLAASRGAWKTAQLLIRLDADVTITDINRRNLLHLVVMNGGRLERFTSEGKQKDTLLNLLNEKDIHGCSPLHYASREGHIRSLETLINLGAVINLKNNNNESPLHFAARYGRYNTVKRLLDSDKGTFIINESDGGGLTPLHISSQQGHTKIVQLLLNRGALLHRDHTGRNPLHLAAMNGFTQTIELLLSVHSHLLDQTDKDGNTALHVATIENQPRVISLLLTVRCKITNNHLDMSAIDYAIYYKYCEAALAMVTHPERGDELLHYKSNKHRCITMALISSMPRVFEAVQDKGITRADCKKDSISFYMKYSFSSLQGSILSDMEDDKNAKNWEPLPALNAMVLHGRVELLAHPLSTKYLQMKWNSYGKYFHVANMTFYSIFLSFVTAFASQLMEQQIPTSPSNFTNMTHADYIQYTKQQILNIRISPAMYVSALGIFSYIGLNIVREIIQIWQQRYLYFMDPINLVTWLLYLSAFIMTLPIFGGDMHDLQFTCASLTVFLSWFNLLLLLQRFDQVGIYVVMFLEILQTLIKVLMVFSILIIAFGLAFYILLSRGEHLSSEQYQCPLVRTFSMMLGEIDFLGTYVKPYYMINGDEKSFLPFPLPAFFILGLFMVLMPILLMNLLIGLAVGDIESVRRNAQLKSLAMQVALHTELERKIPRFLLKRVDKMEVIEYPNETDGKGGILEMILRKWFRTPFSDTSVGMPVEKTEDYILAELEKSKRKLREISCCLEAQQQFLRLIVQKMEIKTEADDVDEGITNTTSPTEGSTKWNSPNIRKKVRSVVRFSNKQN
uniref:TRPA1 n=1 Tax=Agasicles hygrophila TaxID=715812 RepID=A0A7D5RAR9_9CUCU|nr:TRPA1 [Agasicles hygrophila]